MVAKIFLTVLHIFYFPGQAIGLMGGAGKPGFLASMKLIAILKSGQLILKFFVLIEVFQYFSSHRKKLLRGYRRVCV